MASAAIPVYRSWLFLILMRRATELSDASTNDGGKMETKKKKPSKYWTHFKSKDEIQYLLELEEQLNIKFLSKRYKPDGSVSIGTNSIALHRLLSGWLGWVEAAKDRRYNGTDRRSGHDRRKSDTQPNDNKRSGRGNR